MNNNFDRELKDALIKETDHAEKLKENTWETIQHELFAEQTIKKQKRNSIFWVAAMAIIITLVWAGLSTSTGQALMQELKDLFVSEKDIELEIEGQKEDAHVELETNEELSYVIYVDTSRYKLEETETGDNISPNPELGDIYPEVSMEISRKEGKTREEQINSIKQEIAEKGMIIRQEENVTTPIEGTVIRAIESGTEQGVPGSEWDTPVFKYYVTNERQGQFFLIEQKYFLEAAEGHSVRFDLMLESFEIVSEQYK